MITIVRLEESDMNKVVDIVLSKHKMIHGPTLVALCLRELKVKPANYKRWERQLEKHISRRIFREGYIALKKD